MNETLKQLQDTVRGALEGKAIDSTSPIGSLADHLAQNIQSRNPEDWSRVIESVDLALRILTAK